MTIHAYGGVVGLHNSHYRDIDKYREYKFGDVARPSHRVNFAFWILDVLLRCCGEYRLTPILQLVYVYHILSDMRASWLRAERETIFINILKLKSRVSCSSQVRVMVVFWNLS